MNKFVCLNYSEIDDYYGNPTEHGIEVIKDFEKYTKELGLNPQYEEIVASPEDGPSENDFQATGWYKGTDDQINQLSGHFALAELYVVSEAEYEAEQKRIQEEMNGDYDPYYYDSVYGLSANI